MYRIAFILALLFAAVADADTIRLRRSAIVEGDAIRLRDIATTQGDRAAALDDMVVASFDGKAQVRIDMATLRGDLSKRGVNWGLLSLTGFNACRVERVQPKQEQEVAPEPAPAPAVTNPGKPIDLTSAVTLKQRIEKFIGENVDGDLEITFADSDADVLGVAAIDGQYTFEPISATWLGRTPMIVRQYEDQKVIGEHRITADVARRQLAVVAKGSLRRGQLISRGDVEIREVLLHDDHVKPLTKIDDAVGNVARGMVRDGNILGTDDVRKPTMIHRGDYIEVHCVSGSIVVRLKARASEDGEMGQLITVRPEGRRGEITVRVIGMGRAVSVASGEFNLKTGRTALQ